MKRKGAKLRKTQVTNANFAWIAQKSTLLIREDIRRERILLSFTWQLQINVQTYLANITQRY